MSPTVPVRYSITVPVCTTTGWPAATDTSSLYVRYATKMSDSSEHYLASFLESTLPSLGLDCDAYGPYLLGLFPREEEDETAELDDDELDNVLELLQGSSETHAEDKRAFANLRAELIRRRAQHRRDLKMKLEHDKKEAKRKQEERRRQEIEEAERIEREKIEMKKKAKEQTAEERMLKLRLVEQYAYDDTIQYDADGNPIEPANDENEQDGDTTESGNPNRVNAKSATKERHEQMRKECEQSKKAAREDTAKQKIMKAEAKEERRKRATKGERKR